MFRRRSVMALLSATALLLAAAEPALAFPPLPSSFYGLVQITDNTPAPGTPITATVPGVSGPVGTGAVTLYDGVLVYSIDVRGDDTDTVVKDGGVNNDEITFHIGGRVIMMANWHGGTNVARNIHPPDAAITVTGPATEGSPVTLNASTTTDAGSDIATYQFDCTNDGTYDTSPSATATTECTYTDNGTYTVRVRVIDGQGGVSTDTTVVTVNNVSPVVDAGADTAINEGGTFTGNGSFTDPGADTWTATVNYGDGGAAGDLPLTDKTFSLSHTYAQEGAKTITVCVTDDDTGTDCDEVVVTVNNVAPTVSAGADTNLNEGDMFIRSGTFTDPGADEWTATVDYGEGPAPIDLTLDTVNKTFALNNIYEQEGDYTVTVCVNDGGGAICDTVLVTIANVAPVVDAGTDSAISEGDTFTGNGSFTDPGADTWTATVNYGDSSGTNALSLSDKTFSLSHAYAQDGLYTVEVCVKDALSATPVCDTLAVTVGNVAPVVSAGADATINEGETFTRDGSFTDPGADNPWTATANYGDGSTDQPLTLTDKTFSLSHLYGNTGAYVVTVKVHDDDAESTDTVNVTVNNVLPTNVSAGGPYDTIAGQTVNLHGTATCVAGDDCVFTWDLDNDGLYDDATGPNQAVHWNTAGDYPISLRVTDNDGTSDTGDVTVHVGAATHSIDLVPGWNLVSFNLRPPDTDVVDVLSSLAGNYDLVYAWDGATQSWLRHDNVGSPYDPLSTLTEKMGFWIHMTAADTLVVAGSVPDVSTNIPLYSNGSGWNLVGYPSLGTNALPGALSGHGAAFSLAYAYHANDPIDQWKVYDQTALPWSNDLTEMAPYWGYWIKASAPSTWNVPYP